MADGPCNCRAQVTEAVADTTDIKVNGVSKKKVKIYHQCEKCGHYWYTYEIR